MRSTLLAVVVLTGVVAAAQAPQPWTVRIQPLQLTAERGSNGPQLSVSKKGVLVSWLESGDDGATLKFAERTSGGWTQPVKVASGEDWFVTDADTPSVLRLSNGTLVADWMQASSEEFEASNLRLTYSKDEGKTWVKSFLPHHDGTITQHAFATLFERPDGALGLVWLDGRLTVKDREKGPMTLRYGAYDAQWKQISDRALDTKVCDCCTTSVAMTPDGPIVVYRNRTDTEIRDIYVSRNEKGVWTPGKAVHDDGWRIEACPVNGPVIGARGRDVVVAWFAAPKDQGQAYAAFSTDAGLYVWQSDQARRRVFAWQSGYRDAGRRQRGRHLGGVCQSALIVPTAPGRALGREVGADHDCRRGRRSHRGRAAARAGR